MSDETKNFEWGIARYLKVTLPAVKALALLEANSARADNVFIYWHAFIHEIHTALTGKKSGFPVKVQEEIISLINYRYDQVLGTGKLSSPVHLAAAYLNPGISLPVVHFRCLLIESESIQYRLSEI